MVIIKNGIIVWVIQFNQEVLWKSHDPNWLEIPLWLYFSDSYISEHFQIVNTLKEHIDTPYTNDLLFETVLGIIGGANSEFYNKRNDLSSAAYKHSFNDIKTLHGAKKLKMILF